MRLKISHMTEYTYAEPVEFALQRLRLTPQDGPGQHVLNWQTSVTGAGREARISATCRSGSSAARRH
jgi:transglutaminase-like putative cysteine protease